MYGSVKRAGAIIAAVICRDRAYFRCVRARARGIVCGIGLRYCRASARRMQHTHTHTMHARTQIYARLVRIYVRAT